MKKMISEIVQLVPTWNPQRMMIDFEKATINAFSKNFPSLQLTSLFFPSEPKYLSIFTDKSFCL